MKKLFGFTALIAVSVLSLGLAPLAHASDFTPFVKTMSIGSRSAEVTKLQMFLAADASIYPAGLVTGYYGPMTAAAVTQFQVSYNLPQVGVVGPMTLAAMNKMNANGLTLDIQVPIIANVAVQTSGTTASIRWNTSEAARGVVYYDTQPIRSDETSQGFSYPYVSGTLVPADNNNLHSSQNVTLSGLSVGSIYYFLVESIDPSGNLSITMPSSFTAR